MGTIKKLKLVEVKWNKELTAVTCSYTGHIGHINIFHKTNHIVVVRMSMMTAYELLCKCRRKNEELRKYPIQLEVVQKKCFSSPKWLNRFLDYTFVLVKNKIKSTGDWFLVSQYFKGQGL